jgi:hypothetical protein
MIEKGHGLPTPIMEAFSQSNTNVGIICDTNPSGLKSHTSIQPNKVLFVKDKLPVGIIHQ